MRWMSSVVLALAWAGASAQQVDPMGTGAWDARRVELFGDAPVVFDERVRVVAPAVAENPLQVPVAVSVDASIHATRVLVFTDYNPILRVLAFEPQGARPFLGFRVKMQQSGPVRAAVRDADGTWRVGHAWVATTGGGCTLPALGRGEKDWETRLGEVSGRVWAAAGQGARARARIIHPMDTGLAPGIPAFHIRELALRDDEGRPLMQLEVFEPVSENPVFTFEVPGDGGAPVRLTGSDNNGNRIAARLLP